MPLIQAALFYTTKLDIECISSSRKMMEFSFWGELFTYAHLSTTGLFVCDLSFSELKTEESLITFLLLKKEGGGQT